MIILYILYNYSGCWHQSKVLQKSSGVVELWNGEERYTYQDWTG
jgi:hypothetical protein